MTQESKQKSNRTPTTSSENENNVNGFMALKKLKQTDDHVDMMKKRVMVLKAKEEENQKKIIKNQHKYSYHQFIQQKMQEDKDNIKNMEKEKHEQVQKYKELARKMKLQQQQKIRTVRAEELLKKRKQNNTQRKQHYKNEDIVNKKRKFQLEEKQQWRRRMSSIQREQRQRVNLFKESRIRDTYNSKTLETRKFMKQTQSKEKQLSQLSQLELKLAQKYSQSLLFSQKLKENPEMQRLPEISSNRSQDTITNKQTIS